MNNLKDYILVFDSGLGGISVLRELVKQLPHENFVYFGDSKNAPYGDKSTQEIIYLTTKTVDYFARQGIKAVVIACNTATAAAAPTLRKNYPQIPIICIEPAIKQASAEHPAEDILVLATVATLRLEKFNRLKNKLSHQAKIISLPCPGLVELIEEGDLFNPKISQYLEKKLAPYRSIKTVVLGCTHYPFIKQQIQDILPGATVYDSALGTSLELKRQLECLHLQASESQKGQVIFSSSTSNEKLMKGFFITK